MPFLLTGYISISVPLPFKLPCLVRQVLIMSNIHVLKNILLEKVVLVFDIIQNENNNLSDIIFARFIIFVMSQLFNIPLYLAAGSSVLAPVSPRQQIS